jgi:hypothetical protein
VYGCTKTKDSYQISHGNKRLLFCGNIIWPFTGTNIVVSADTERVHQHVINPNKK